jgi:hypothetical protein
MTDEGIRVILWTRHGDGNQKFCVKFHEIEGYYTLRAMHSYLFLGVAGSVSEETPSSPSDICQFGWSETNRLKWIICPLGDNL